MTRVLIRPVARRAPSGKVAFLGFLLAFVTFIGVLIAIEYIQLANQVVQACDQAAAAAKLDLGSLIPLCKEMHR